MREVAQYAYERGFHFMTHVGDPKAWFYGSGVYADGTYGDFAGQFAMLERMLERMVIGDPPGHSDRILDVSEAESESLLADLFAVLYDPANVMEHHWNVGDLVLWDNVALHHGRPDFPADEARTLQRVTLGDYTPGELVSNLTELLAGRHASPGSGIR